MSNKKIYTSVGLPKELLEAIDKDAREERRSRSNTVVKRLLEHYQLPETLAEENGHANQI